MEARPIRDTNPKITAGIDVGKAHLELSINAGPIQTFANDPESIAALAVYEPTGGYERLLTTLLAGARVPARWVHPNQAPA